MNWMCVPTIVVAGLLGAEGDPSAAPEATVTIIEESPVFESYFGDGGRRLFQSDRAFENFIGPVSNPILAKDPRSLTELRPLFINNWIDGGNPLGSGDFQVVACQARLAITDRLTLIADKDGYAFIHPNNLLASSEGWLNLAAGLKYQLIRDVENQFMVTAGTMYELQSGEAGAFQSQGDGIFSFFGVVGKEIAEVNHFLFNFGFELPVDRVYNSSFFYAQLHADRQLFGWLYPLAELNWYHYTSGGNWGIPNALGEGDGLINFGTSGVAGNDLVTVALGLKARLSWNVETAVVWEKPISNRQDLIGDRLIAELILRY